MNGDKFSIVTVNFNASAYTEKMLNSVSGFDQYVAEVVVVDNFSREDDRISLEKVISDFRRKSSVSVKLVLSDCNLGYFGGLNLGLSKVKTKERLGAIICNNDIVFDDHFFNRLSLKKVDEDCHAICPSVRTIDGIYQNPSMVSRPSFLRVFFYDLYYSNYYIGRMIISLWHFLGFGTGSNTIKDDEEKEIFIGIGAIYYLTPYYFLKNTDLPTDTFLYGEEAFLAKKIFISGGVQKYCPDIEVMHYESISTQKMLGKEKYKLNKSSYKKIRSFYKMRF